MEGEYESLTQNIAHIERTQVETRLLQSCLRTAFADLSDEVSKVEALFQVSETKSRLFQHYAQVIPDDWAWTLFEKKMRHWKNALDAEERFMSFFNYETDNLFEDLLPQNTYFNSSLNSGQDVNDETFQDEKVAPKKKLSLTKAIRNAKTNSLPFPTFKERDRSDTNENISNEQLPLKYGDESEPLEEARKPSTSTLPTYLTTTNYADVEDQDQSCENSRVQARRPRFPRKSALISKVNKKLTNSLHRR